MSDTTATPTIFPLISKPGIKRDGTVFEGDSYTDGEWVRFQRGLPRKIGGCQQIVSAFSGISRGCYVFPQNTDTRVFSGYSAGLEVVDISSTGGAGGIVNRTPTGFAASSDNLFQFDAIYDALGTAQAIVMHAAPNLSSISSTTATQIYYGNMTDGGTLLPTGISVSGGICVSPPYLFAYGSDGYVTWSVPNQPNNFSTGSGGGGTAGARVAATKVVRGFPVRGGPGSSPSAIFWSLDAVVRASFVGGSAVFDFDTITDQSSILSSQSVIEYDGLFYWPGVDRFLVYNGVVREVPNDMNINWFFDNLNRTYAQKVFAVKVPRFGEIWWFFPYGTSTECNAAIIYNVRENTWYDTGFSPQAKRAAAYFAQVFHYPLMFGTESDDSGKYALWQHEIGTDAVAGQVSNAILSMFETADFSYPDGGPTHGWSGLDANMNCDRIEPDFIQSGDMTMTVIGRKFARSTEVESTPYPMTPTTEKIDLRQEFRQMRFRFTSNVSGGNYQMGQTLAHFKPGDKRPA